jgi:hypothetical protein
MSEYLNIKAEDIKKRGLSISVDLPTVKELLSALIKVPEEDVDLKVSIISQQEHLKPHFVKMGLRIICLKDDCYLLIGDSGKDHKENEDKDKP